MTWLPARSTVVAFVSLLVIAAIDFSGRVLVLRDATLRGFKTPEAVSIPAARTPAGVQSDLAAWVPALASPQSAPLDPESPDAWDLRLIGIFRERRLEFAVVAAVPKAAGLQAMTRRLGIGDEMAGYQLREIRRDTVLLHGSEGDRELRLYPERTTRP